MKRLLLLFFTSLLLVSCNKKSQNIKDISLFEKEQIKELDRIKIPDLKTKDIIGNEVSLSDYYGKVIILNFWAQWCGPCVEEMPYFQNLHERVKDSDIVVITINVGESRESVKEFISTNNYTFITLLDIDKKLSNTLSIRSIPSTFILNKNGEIVGSKLGSHKWDSDGVVEILEELNRQ